jgi:hypothetical protein
MKGIFSSKRLDQAMLRSMRATNISPTPKYAFKQGWIAACKFLERVHNAEEICCQCGKLLYDDDNYFLFDEIGCFCEKCYNKIDSKKRLFKDEEK